MARLRRSYPRNQSRLFRVTSPSQLAERVDVAFADLEMLERASDNYIRWTDKKTGRPIQRPKPKLDRIHRRAAVLLPRMIVPDYLHSAVKGRSYITNAHEHDARLPSIKIDIRQFYPSTRAAAVFHFFRDRMECDGDVAGVLAKLLTVDGHLATGSSVSPILSFLAYEDMFEEINTLATARGCTMTCYVDDVVITGPSATPRMVWEVKSIMRRYRLWGHKTRTFRAGQARVITGVAITHAGPRLPNKRKRKIAETIAQLQSAANDTARLKIARRAVGLLHEAAQIDPIWRPQADAMVERKRGIARRMKSSA